MQGDVNSNSWRDTLPLAPQRSALPLRGVQRPVCRLTNSVFLVAAADRQLTSVAAETSQELADVLRCRPARLLVVDVEWCAAVGSNELRHLRRVVPATDWLLRWPEPSARWLEVIVDTRARGALVRQDGNAALARAVDGVLAGKLWFPREVTRWLYDALLDGSAHDDDGHDLTPREAQALELMRHGLTNKQIAERLAISANTVKKHLASAFEKCGLRHRRQALCGGAGTPGASLDVSMEITRSGHRRQQGPLPSIVPIR